MGYPTATEPTWLNIAPHSVSSKKISRKRLRHLLKEADKDNSGEVDFAEFTELLAGRIKGVQVRRFLLLFA